LQRDEVGFRDDGDLIVARSNETISGHFDYIIVGAGAAGCVLADRLTADGRSRVLLLEEGRPNDSWLLRMPKGIGKVLASDRYVHRYRTTYGGSDGVPREVWLRGKTLGGSSSVNGMIWIRGQSHDYDSIAAAGNPGWSWKDMLPYFRRLEKHASGESELRGGGGPINVKTHPDRSALADAFIASGKAIGLPDKDDHNSANQEGIGYLQVNIDSRGRRSGAVQGFLDPARGRKNLEVLTGVRVDRLLVEDGKVAGVEGRRGPEKVCFRAGLEVILSAGAIVSPLILQRSGIGPAALLAQNGVPVVLDSPGVGRNLREHWLLNVEYGLRRAEHSQNGIYAGAHLVRLVLRYLLFGKGPMSHGAYEAAAFVRSMPGIDRPDGQVMIAPWTKRPDGTFGEQPEIHVFGQPLRPQSVGTIAITGPDPDAPPLIEPNYLSAPLDRACSVALMRLIRRLMAEPAMQEIVTGETARTAWAQSDEEILQAFRRLGRAGFHAVGTCAMGQGREAVLDERLRLRGMPGLRVIDCSIFPEMISGNTHAPVMAAAWRASNFVLEDRDRPRPRPELNRLRTLPTQLREEKEPECQSQPRTM
jgi:choline dehydrogenase